ncbi:MAG: fibronectin type III domain-containing protein, partial [Acidobacteriota bacterium]
DEAATARVEYGTTTGYGSTTAVDSTMKTSHTRVLEGLTEATTYHYRVISTDEAGNTAESGDYTFTTLEPEDTTPPEISGVMVSGQTGTEAVITWTTDEAADSQVIFGTTVEYGQTTDLDSVTVFSHTQVLKDLELGTTYHFRVLSSDESGNLAESDDYTFTTMEVAFTQTMPLINSAITVQDDLYVGAALIKESGASATVAFTAFDENGNMIEGEGLQNPAVLQIAPFQQLSLVDVEIFGNNLSKFCADGWIRVESTSADVSGFALTFDGSLRLMDGVRFAYNPMNAFVFTHIESNGRTGISLINPNSKAIEVTIELVQEDGSVKRSISKVIGGKSAMTDDLYAEVFAGLTPDPSDYVRVSSESSMEPFQMIQQGTADISFLRGQGLQSASHTLYLPRYVYDKGYRTDISVVNMDSEAGQIQARLIANNGLQIGVTRTLQIAANGKLFIDGPEFFMDQNSVQEQSIVTNGRGKGNSEKGGPKNGKGNSSPTVDGYVEIVSSGIQIVGSTSYRGRNSQSFMTAYPLVTELQDRIVFGHVVSDDLYSTELGVANPGEANADVVLELFNVKGDLIETVKVSVPAEQQTYFSVRDCFKTLRNSYQTGGYIILSSNVPVTAFSSFSTLNQSVVSAIPVH